MPAIETQWTPLPVCYYQENALILKIVFLCQKRQVTLSKNGDLVTCFINVLINFFFQVLYDVI